MIDFEALGEFIYKFATPIIAFVSLGLNIMQITRDWLNKQKKFKFCITKIQRAGNTLFVRYWIDNLSSKPVNLIRVKLLNEDYRNDECDAFSTPLVVSEDTDIEKLFHKGVSEVTPIFVDGYYSHGGYFAFCPLTQTGLDNEKSALLILTDKGKPIKIPIILNQIITVTNRRVSYSTQ